MEAEMYDVIVVGASIAGSTAATLLGRAGLRVALVERHHSIDTFKVLCTHHVMACATPTIRRLGLDRRIEAAGGIRNGLDCFTPWGWVVSPPDSPHGYSIRRARLDPMVRELAAGTSGVDLMLGQKAIALLDGEGVRLRGDDGTERSVRGRLVVGADGVNSVVAQLAGAGQRVAPNERFIFFAEFTNVRLTSGSRTQIWLHEPGIAYAMPNEDGITVLASMPVKADLPSYRADRESALLASLRRLPDGPVFDDANRVSRIVGATDCPLITRTAVPRSGVALIGDAALTSDPSQGVGCGWAFQTAEWLADAVTPALLDGGRLEPALRQYVRRRKALNGHQSTIEDQAKAGPPTPVDRLMLGAAVRDPRTAAHMLAFVNRTIGLRQLLAPSAIARAAWTNLHHSAVAAA
ncbi:MULTISPECIES: NAD(P)/FAD-dependent oxidoreductase [unclassified Kribbella]|uniref:NAD(P)/FAD-dependent oxidoreductase n=1 Tax=unclassified Kribbella TaxID=2644121 RepID=UPI003016B73C